MAPEMASEVKPSLFRRGLMQFGWSKPIAMKPVDQYTIDSGEYSDRIAWNFSKVIYPVIITMVATLYLKASRGDSVCEYNAPERENFSWEFDPLSPYTYGAVSEPISDNIIVWIVMLTVWLILLVLATFAMVFLLKRQLQWLLFWLLYVSVFVFLGALGGRYLFYWVRSICWSFDWITLCYLSFNFCVGGVISIFFKAPRWLNQAYLITLSALVGDVFISSAVPQWYVWSLLGCLIIWDLFAVLAPCGPLQELIRVAGERQNDLPGLLYDTNPVARGREDLEVMRRRRERRNRDREQTTDYPAPALPPGAAMPSRSRGRTSQGQSVLNLATDDGESGGPPPTLTVNFPRMEFPVSFPDGTPPTALETRSVADEGAPSTPDHPLPNGEEAAPEVNLSLDDREDASTEARPVFKAPLNLAERPTPVHREGNPRHRGHTDAREASKFLDKHLKLGLGDFIFYSVLVSLSAQLGFMAVTTSFVGVVSGLCITFMILITFHRPLPALPISLFFGIVAYFVTRYGLSPFVGNLLENMLFN